jgi:hypothetical protein
LSPWRSYDRDVAPYDGRVSNSSSPRRDFRKSDRSSDTGDRGRAGKRFGSGRGGGSRREMWKRSSAPNSPRPASVRVAAARADLELALRALETATNALRRESLRVPSAVALEHAKELDREAMFGPWSRLRSALADVEMTCSAVERLKFPPKPFASRESRPKLGR